MFDVVYPIAPFSKDGDDFELRYSLRSLAEQPWVRNVVVVGHAPGWLQDVIHLPCPDPYRNCKDANIINKIMFTIAAMGTWLSREFVVNSDDQIFLKQTSREELLPRLENPDHRLDYQVKGGANNWHRRVMDTIQWCEKQKLPNWIFQAHRPYMVNRNNYPLLMSRAPWGWGNGLVTHVYYNLSLKTEPPKEPIGETARIKMPFTLKVVRQVVKDSKILNFNNNGLNPALKIYLQERFAKRSPWEAI